MSAVRIRGTVTGVRAEVSAEGAAYVYLTVVPQDHGFRLRPGHYSLGVVCRRFYGKGEASLMAAFSAARRLNRGMQVYVHAAGFALDTEGKEPSLVMVGVDHVEVLDAITSWWQRDPADSQAAQAETEQ